MTSLARSVSADLADISVDEVPSGVTAALLVAPRSIEDVARVMSVAAPHGARVMPVGSGSTLDDVETDIAVTTSRLGGVLDYQPDDLTIVVGAGAKLHELNEVLADRDLSAVLPETTRTRTVGGVVASGASGYRRLRYGPTRDRVLEVSMATGYGEVVRAGGRLVKNVTGYDLARLTAGSFGSLGIIGSVCLKLWPVSGVRRTVTVDDAASALESLFRPVAVLETESGSSVYLQGDRGTVDRQIEELGGSVTEGFQWPNAKPSPVQLSLRIPPRDVVVAVQQARQVDPSWFVAQHGVGVIEMGMDSYDEDVVRRIRSWAEERRGSLVVSASGLSAADRWGTRPSTFAIQQRMKSLFDPAGICNPGALPGGL